MLRRPLVLALVLALPLSGHAQNVIDVNQPTTSGFQWGGINYSRNVISFQTFKPLSALSTGAGFLLWNTPLASDVPFGGSGLVTIYLWAGDPVPLNLAPVARSSTSISIPFGQSAWVDAFWSPTAVTPGNTYWLGVLGQPQLTSWYTSYVNSTPTDVYADGSVYLQFLSNFGLGGSSYSIPGYDLTFRTYTSGAEVVPEPATMTLLATGLAGMAAARRKRRKV